MSYETAESTALLATNCCACARPLRDAKSVELGIGPVCREKYGFNVEVDPAARAEANGIIHAVACAQRITAAQDATLRELGFATIADKLARQLKLRRGRRELVEVTSTAAGYTVKAPYVESAIAEWRSVGRWDSATKTRLVREANKAALWKLLKKHYAGLTLVSTKGETVIGEVSKVPVKATLAAPPVPPAAPPAKPAPRRRDFAGDLEAALRRQFSAAVTEDKRTR